MLTRAFRRRILFRLSFITNVAKPPLAQFTPRREQGCLRGEALLAQFTVELSQDGKVYLENKSVNPEVFRKTMDEWNQDYEGTLSLTNLLREFKREFEELVEKSYKFM